MDNIQTIAVSLVKQQDPEQSFRNEIKKLEFDNKSLRKKYSIEEFNRLNLYCYGKLNYEDFNKEDKFYFNGRTITSIATKSSDAGLYRFHTSEDFRMSIKEDKIYFKHLYRTQRDHSSRVSTGTEASFYYDVKHSCFIFDDSFEKETSYKVEEIQTIFNYKILKFSYNNKLEQILIVNKSETKTFMDLGKNLISTNHSLSVNEFSEISNFLINKFLPKNSFMAKTTNGNIITVLVYKQSMHLNAISEIEIPVNVKHLNIKSSDFNGFKLNENIKTLDINEPINFSLSKIPNTVEDFIIHLPNDGKLNDFKKFTKLKRLLIFGIWESKKGCVRIKLPENWNTYKDLGIFNKVEILTRLDKFAKNFRWDSSQVKFYFSDYFCKYPTYYYNNLRTPDGKTYYYETDHKTIKCSQKTIIENILKIPNGRSSERKININPILDWIKFFKQPEKYVEKYKRLLINKAKTESGYASITSGCYHIETSFDAFKLWDIVEDDNGIKWVCTFKEDKNISSYFVKLKSFYKDHIIYEDVTSKGIQVTTDGRLENLMIDLYPENRMPYRGWRRRKINLKVVDKFDPLKVKEISELTNETIYDYIEKYY